MTQNVNFTRTQIAILTLLESEDINGERHSPIPGRTHLIKEIFAISQSELGKKLLPELKFEPDNYGPFDETVFAALESLRDSGFVCFDTSLQPSKIKLTPKGIKAADNLWAKINDDVKGLFSFTKKNLNHLTSEKLLDKIYSAHPEMTINSKSKIADKYRVQN